MSKQTIWNELKRRGFSDIAVAAIMGNMEGVVGTVTFDETLPVCLEGREILLPATILIFGAS